LCLVVLFGLIAGCTTNPLAPARVSGKVTYKGAAVPAGNIVFHSQDQGSYRCALTTDGSYEIRDVPKGPMVVTVETESVNPNKKVQGYGSDKGAKDYQARMAAEGKAASEKMPDQTYLKIPGKYAVAQTSPLNVTLEAGSNTHSFDLTD